MSTLYELTQQAKDLYELLQNDDIDIQTFNDTVEAIGTEEKLEAYAKIIRQFEADAEAFKAEKDRLADRQKSAENSVDRMKKMVIEFLNAIGKTETKAGIFAFKLSESKSVRVDDDGKLDKQYLIPQEPKIDKATIRKIMLTGEPVSGCSWDVKIGVRIK